MKKTLATLAIAALALTGCATTNNTEPAETATTATAEATNAPSETQQAQKVAPVESTQEASTEGYTAHVADNGDITWTDAQGNTVENVSWDVVNSYPFTQEELGRIQQGFDELAQEAEAEADALVEAEFGQSTPEATFDPSDTAIPGDAQHYEEQASSGDDMRSYCENLDQATASSGELQMCYTNYGL